jgi:GNAT superfamily N-acetyltransferase
MGVIVRTATARDIGAMHRIRTDVRENRLSDPQRVTEASYAPFVAAGTAWVAEIDGRVGGFAAVDAGAASVWALFVDRSLEGAGLGRALHARLVDWANEQRIQRLSLSTERGTRAADFYQRAGWKHKGMAKGGQLAFELILSRCLPRDD